MTNASCTEKREEVKRIETNLHHGTSSIKISPLLLIKLARITKFLVISLQPRIHPVKIAGRLNGSFKLGRLINKQSIKIPLPLVFFSFSFFVPLSLSFCLFPLLLCARGSPELLLSSRSCYPVLSSVYKLRACALVALRERRIYTHTHERYPRGKTYTYTLRASLSALDPRGETKRDALAATRILADRKERRETRRSLCSVRGCARPRTLDCPCKKLASVVRIIPFLSSLALQ